MLRSYFLWRNFILLPEETEKRKWTPHSDRQNKCHFPPMCHAVLWACRALPIPWKQCCSWDLASSQAHPPEPICPGHTSTAALKWPRTDKRIRDVILTPDQIATVSNDLSRTSDLRLELLASSPLQCKTDSILEYSWAVPTADP